MSQDQGNSINNILDIENQRLVDKKINVDQAVSGEERMIMLNDSYRKKYNSYIRIILVSIIGLVVLIILKLLKKYIPIIPDYIITILFIIVIAVVVTYDLFVLMDINGRSPFNYDELVLPPPSNVGTPSASQLQSAVNAGDLLATTASLNCNNASCCDGINNIYLSLIHI